MRRTTSRSPSIKAPEARAWLVAALLFSAGLAWRHSEVLQALDLVATGGCLAMAAVSLRDPAWMLLRARVRDALWALLPVARATGGGVLPVALRARLDAESLPVGRHDRRAIARAAAISAVLLVVFGLLLLSADPIFASLLSIPHFDAGMAVSHVLIFGFFAWIVGGWARGALDEEAIAPAPDRFGFTLSPLDITMSLGMLNLLFAGYVGAQLTWFFGGETYLQAETGLTASAYARRGFFELVWVAVLVVPLVLVTLTVLREQGRSFLAGAAVTGFATLAALNVANPDAIIARVNLDRAATTLSPDAAGLDLVHLATLGGEAAEMAATAIISAPNARCGRSSTRPARGRRPRSSDRCRA